MDDEVDEFPPQVHMSAAIMRLQEALERARISGSTDSACVISSIHAAIDSITHAMKGVES